MQPEPGGCREPSTAQCFSDLLHLQGYNRMAPPVTKGGSMHQSGKWGLVLCPPCEADA